jgi:hypothetical protein
VKRQDSVSSLRSTPFAVQALSPSLALFFDFSAFIPILFPVVSRLRGRCERTRRRPVGPCVLRMCASAARTSRPRLGGTGCNNGSSRYGCMNAVMGGGRADPRPLSLPLPLSPPASTGEREWPPNPSIAHPPTPTQPLAAWPPQRDAPGSRSTEEVAFAAVAPPSSSD